MRFETADAVVIGGGPAGSTAATLLKLSAPSRRVVLYERARFPRHRIGEGLLPEANNILFRMGVLERLDAAGFQAKRGASFLWRRDAPVFSETFVSRLDEKRTFGEHLLPAYSWCVDRSRYDQILLERAAEVGVEVFEETSVTEVLRDPSDPLGVQGVRVAGPAGEVELATGYVVDCSGQARLVPRALGLTQRHEALGEIAIYRYYEGFDWDPEAFRERDLATVFLVSCPAGWIWAIPLSNTYISVGLVSRRELLPAGDKGALLDEQIRAVPRLAAILAGARQVAGPATDSEPRVLATSGWTYQHDEVAGPGWYLAGDAAGFVDPILSSGVYLAHRSGMMAANAILTDWHGHPHDRERVRRSYTRYWRDSWRGFAEMAHWWYRGRDSGIDNWWRRARELTAHDPAAARLDDKELFLHFINGYLADFRFPEGIGFGVDGLAQVFRGLGREDDAQAVEVRIDRRASALVRRYTSAEPGLYLTTDPSVDHWFEMPMVTFDGPGGRYAYRPMVPTGRRSPDDLRLTFDLLGLVLELADGRHTIEEISREARRRLGASDERHVHHVVNLVMADLTRLGLLEVLAEGDVETAATG